MRVSLYFCYRELHCRLPEIALDVKLKQANKTLCKALTTTGVLQELAISCVTDIDLLMSRGREVRMCKIQSSAHACIASSCSYIYIYTSLVSGMSQ